jgi:O-antigen/teichoic acid export membrane protein
MSIIKDLLKNTIIYSIGNLGSKILVFILIPIYTFYLNKSELGYYDLIISLISLIVPLVSFQIGDAVYRWLLDSDKQLAYYKKTVSSSLLVILLSISITIILTFFINQNVNIKYLYHISFIIISTIFYSYLQQISRGLSNNISYSISGLIYTVSLLIFNIIFLKTINDKILGLLISIYLANCIAIIYILLKINIIKYVKVSFISKSLINEMLTYSWPLIPNAVSWWIVTLANRYIIIEELGYDSNGIFALANRFPAIILILNTIFMLAFQDHIIKAKNNQSISHQFNIFAKGLISFILILIPLSRIIVYSIVDIEFVDSWQYISILYCGILFSSLSGFLGALFISNKLTKSIFYTTMFGGILNLFITQLFIQKIGLYAPCIGTLIGFISIWIIRTNQLQKRICFSIDLIYLIKLLLILIVYILLSRLENNLIDLILFVLAVIISIQLNQEILKKLISLLCEVNLKKLVLKN